MQLTDGVVESLIASQLSNVTIFTFKNETAVKRRRTTCERCKTYPGDPLWPSEGIWNLFDVLLGGALIKTIPEAAVCDPAWPVYNAAKCEELSGNFQDSRLR